MSSGLIVSLRWMPSIRNWRRDWPVRWITGVVWPNLIAPPPEEALKRVAARAELSDDVREIVTRALQD
jgi:hypothetical protein